MLNSIKAKHTAAELVKLQISQVPEGMFAFSTLSISCHKSNATWIISVKLILSKITTQNFQIKPFIIHQHVSDICPTSLSRSEFKFRIFFKCGICRCKVASQMACPALVHWVSRTSYTNRLMKLSLALNHFLSSKFTGHLIHVNKGASFVIP